MHRRAATFGGDDAINPVTFAKIFDAARKVLAPIEGETDVPVLLLDDAHRLDSASLTMVDRLMAHGALFCSTSVVTGEAVPEMLTRWWRDERAARVDRELDQVGPDVMSVKFADELDAIVQATSSLDAFASPVRELAARHAAQTSGSGVQTQHYHAVGEALTGALAARLGPEWDVAPQAACRQPRRRGDDGGCH